MSKRLVKYILLFIICLTGFSARSSAQFKEDAFSQTYATDTTAAADTADQLFSFKELFDGLSHKDEMRIGTMLISLINFLILTLSFFASLIKFHNKFSIILSVSIFITLFDIYSHLVTKSFSKLTNTFNKSSSIR